MNPIQKALDTADTVQAANRELERLSALQVIPTVTDSNSAVAFLEWAVKRLGGGFHPDTRGNDYLAFKDGSVAGATFNESEAIYFDNQIAQVFRFLPDPYAITLDLVHVDEQERIDKVEYTLAVGVHPRTDSCNPGTCEIDHAVEVHGETDLHGEPIKTSLVIAFDVTGWSKEQIDSLATNAIIQGEEYREDRLEGEPDGSYPDVHGSTYEVVEHDGDLDLTGVLHVGLGH